MRNTYHKHLWSLLGPVWRGSRNAAITGVITLTLDLWDCYALTLFSGVGNHVQGCFQSVLFSLLFEGSKWFNFCVAA